MPVHRVLMNSSTCAEILRFFCNFLADLAHAVDVVREQRCCSKSCRTNTFGNLLREDFYSPENQLSTESPFSWPEQTDHRSKRRPDSHRTIERMSVYHDNTQIPDTVPCMISRFFSIASRPQGLNAELHTGTYILC